MSLFLVFILSYRKQPAPKTKPAVPPTPVPQTSSPQASPVQQSPQPGQLQGWDTGIQGANLASPGSVSSGQGGQPAPVGSSTTTTLVSVGGPECELGLAATPALSEIDVCGISDADDDVSSSISGIMSDGSRSPHLEIVEVDNTTSSAQDDAGDDDEDGCYSYNFKQGPSPS